MLEATVFGGFPFANTPGTGGCALVVTGPWEGANLRLRVETSHWSGLAAGTGHLRGRRALVVSSGRGAAGPGRRSWLWLPGPDGTIGRAETEAEETFTGTTAAMAVAG